MKKIYKLLLALIIILLLVSIGLLVYPKFVDNNKSESKPEVITKIKDYNYTLDKRDNKLMKEEFNTLKDILDSDEVDYNEYAKSLAKLFIIDLYTIDTKVNKYDVGSLEYVLDSEKDKFKNMVMDGLYKSLVDNTDEDRDQELPIVSVVNVDNIAEGEFKINDTSYPAYIVNLSWDYKKDLEYDNFGKVTIIKDKSKLFVVEYTPEQGEDNSSEEVEGEVE